MQFNNFKHNELLVAIMTEYLKVKDEENADLSLDNLHQTYIDLFESSNLGDLFDICESAITCHGASLRRGV
jgi:hypothetical protein